MKYALGPRPDAPLGGLAAGIDWASADHAVCVVDADGKVVSRFSHDTSYLSAARATGQPWSTTSRASFRRARGVKAALA